MVCKNYALGHEQCSEERLRARCAAKTMVFFCWISSQIDLSLPPVLREELRGNAFRRDMMVTLWSTLLQGVAPAKGGGRL